MLPPDSTGLLSTGLLMMHFHPESKLDLHQRWRMLLFFVGSSFSFFIVCGVAAVSRPSRTSHIGEHTEPVEQEMCHPPYRIPNEFRFLP